MTPASPPTPLLETIEDALALLSTYQTALPLTNAAEALPSLLQQCEAMAQRSTPQSVRSIHHFACTGGTIISKCVAVQSNVVLLSEIDPLSLFSMSVTQPAFTPRSVIQQLRYSQRGNSDALIEEVFVKEIEVMRSGLARNGQMLVIRDHAHSQYCTGTKVLERPTLLDMLRKAGETRSVLTVRHPLDSFLSFAVMNGLTSFKPGTLQEYAIRYERFLDDHSDLPMFCYEDFAAAPERVTADICATLDLPFDADAMSLSGVIVMSGGSGRKSGKIEPRPRREIPPDILAQTTGPDYTWLCQRLNYDPSAM